MVRFYNSIFFFLCVPFFSYLNRNLIKKKSNEKGERKKRRELNHFLEKIELNRRFYHLGQIDEINHGLDHLVPHPPL